MPNFIEDTTQPETRDANVLDKTQLMQVAGITSNMLQDNKIMMQFKNVLDFLTRFQDGLLQARRVVAGVPNDDRLGVLTDFVQAKSQLEEVRNQLAQREGEVENLRVQFQHLDKIVNNLMKQ